MNLFNFDIAMIFSFLLTLMRASLVIFMFPVFGVQTLPAQWKAAFVLVFTLAVWPNVALDGNHLPSHPFDLMILLIVELLLGLTLGLAVQFFFSGVQAGGELISLQMGFSMITLADPSSGSQAGVIAYFFNMVTILIFLALDGHLYMLKAFAETYNYIPAGGFIMNDTLVRQIILLSNMIFVYAVKIISPVMVALFLTEVGLALMSKAAPQMNIMELGFPVKIMVGFFFVGMIFVLFETEIYNYIRDLDDMFMNIIRAGSPEFQ